MTKFEFTDQNGRHRFAVEIPENWEEMTASQVQFVFRLFEDLANGKLTPLQLQIKVLYHFLGFKSVSADAARNSAIVENVTQMVKYLDFIFTGQDERSGIPQLSFGSVWNPLPTVRVKARTLTGPAALCQDLTFGEFRSAAMSLNDFFRTEDLGSLDECIASLYRPRAARPNRAGRRVKPILPVSFADEIREVSGIPPWQKNLIMMWFSACIGYLQSGTITLGGEEVDMKLLFAGDGDTGGPAATWNDLLVQIAKDGAMGDMDAVDDAPLMTVILHMWSNYKESKRHERALRKAQKH